jgi:miniconductance mechanosensitive channel
MAVSLVKWLSNWLINIGLAKSSADFLVAVILIFFVIGLSILGNYIVKLIIHHVLKRVVKKTKSNWDDILFEFRVFHRFSHVAPAIIIYYCAEAFLKHYKTWLNLTHSAIYIYITVVFILAFSSFLNALNAIYMKSPASAHKPIKGYLQVVNIFSYSIGIIIILSIVFDKDPSYFLTGLGAIAAVLLIVFKDSLLGLMAGIQLSANDMVKIGDWITVPGKNADGVVSDISLNSVKVENFDKTITFIPSYTLVSEAFVNWRGMEMSKARRIRRSLAIDLQSIRFLSVDETEKMSALSGAQVHKEQVLNKNEAAMQYEKETNLYFFRKYCERYLRQHPFIRQDFTLMIRELQPTSTGLPLEIYCFSKTTEWKSYEEIQAGVIEHVISMVPVFGLSLYQNPIHIEPVNPV